MLEKQLSCKQFRDLKIPLVVVASDLYTGELIPMGAGNLVKSVQASCSIPFVFTPCKYMGRILVDGGVINPVPARVAKDLGADVIIAVDLCELLPKTCPSNLFEIASRSAEIAFMWQNQVCTRYADVVIRPKTCGIGTFNDNMKWVLYEAGKRAAREQLPKIKKMIAERCHNACQQKKWKLVHLPPYTPQIYQDP
jgi:NTE family protein